MPLGAILGGAVALITVFFSVGSVLMSIGKVADRVGQNTESLNYLSSDLKGLPTILEKITTLQAVTTTKITDYQTALNQLNNQATIRGAEIQRNSENKMGKDDFFRLYDNLNERMIYLERLNQ